jgi:hypothetical protein
MCVHYGQVLCRQYSIEPSYYPPLADADAVVFLMLTACLYLIDLTDPLRLVY